MLHIPKVGDYLKILANDELEDFLVTNFGFNALNLQKKNYILN